MRKVAAMMALSFALAMAASTAIACPYQSQASDSSTTANQTAQTQPASSTD